jgi:hypothetical protein
LAQPWKAHFRRLRRANPSSPQRVKRPVMALGESKLLSESAILRPELRSFLALSNNLLGWQGRAIVSHPPFSIQLIVEGVDSIESRGSVSEVVDSVSIGPSVSKPPGTPQGQKGCRSGGIAGEAAAEGGLQTPTSTSVPRPATPAERKALATRTPRTREK